MSEEDKIARPVKAVVTLVFLVEDCTFISADDSFGVDFFNLIVEVFVEFRGGEKGCKLLKGTIERRFVELYNNFELFGV